MCDFSSPLGNLFQLTLRVHWFFWGFLEWTMAIPIIQGVGHQPPELVINQLGFKLFHCWFLLCLAWFQIYWRFPKKKRAAYSILPLLPITTNYGIYVFWECISLTNVPQIPCDKFAKTIAVVLNWGGLRQFHLRGRRLVETPSCFNDWCLA